MEGQGLKRLVERAIRKRVAVRVERDPRRLVAVEPRPGRGLQVRVHPAVLDSDRLTQRLLVEFIRRPRRDVRRRIQSRLLLRAGAVRLAPEKQIQHGRLGRVHNLQAIYQKVNRRYFGGRLDVEVLWGRNGRRQRHQSIDFGSYEQSQKAIRINPALDRGWVPNFFVEYILFHEMLHAAVGFRRRGGRRLLHPPEFMEKERRFRLLGAAARWERSNLWRFVRA
jgi:hypothetical protein